MIFKKIKDLFFKKDKNKNSFIEKKEKKFEKNLPNIKRLKK
jgi:hypothetical protein